MATKEHPGAARRAFSAGRYSTAHVLTGLALAGGALAASALLTRRPAELDDRPPPVVGLIWPPLFSALTLSGLRLWGAPPSRAKTRALTLWSLLVGFGAMVMALGPRRFGGALTASVASLGTAAAYAWQSHAAQPSPADAPPRAAWSVIARNAAIRRPLETQATLH